MRGAEVFAAIRRKPDFNPTANKGAASGSALPSGNPLRMSGTVPTDYESYEANPKDGELGTTNGRNGNDQPMPNGVRGRFDVGQINGDRLQQFANTHLSEGPAMGRIPRGWNDRAYGVLGRDISGNPDGDDSFASVAASGPSNTGTGGIGDMKFVPHTPTPRNVGIARTYLRTVDDAAQIPGVFLSDPTRR